MTANHVSAIVFDLGGVLIDWNPRHLYRPLFRGDDAAMEQFLSQIATPEWNAELDAGRPFAVAVDELAREHPEQRNLIRAYDERWSEMLAGPIADTVSLLDELRDAGVRLLALSNWSLEKYPAVAGEYEFLSWFEAVVLSGELGIAKPDERVFRHVIDRFGIEPEVTVYVDDSVRNVEAASRLGFIGIAFEGADDLRRRLVGLGVFAAADPV